MIRNRLQRLPAVFFLLLLLASPVTTWAQRGRDVDKLMRKAESKFNAYNLLAAEELYNSVLDVDPNNFEAAYKLGLINSYLQDYRDALRWAVRFVDQLSTLSPRKRLGLLRRFHTASRQNKLRLIRDLDRSR